MPKSQHPTTAQLAQRFASVFSDPAARRRLSRFRSHVRLPIFNLTTTSLRHLRMWFDRLNDINRGIAKPHGNYFSDPAAIGLVDNSVRPRVLTQAGISFLSWRPILRNNPLRAEYELLKILYFSNIPIDQSARSFLSAKRNHLFAVLSQFSPAPSRQTFLTHPQLLVIAELISGFRGAIQALVDLPQADLAGLASLGENRFKHLCPSSSYPAGLAALCNKIGSDYTRGEERRLHYLVSMALLAIAQGLPSNKAVSLVVPSPFCNLLTEADIYNLHGQYTSDLNVWFDGLNFQVSSSLSIPPTTVPLPAPIISPATLQPITSHPSGISNARANDPSRRTRRTSGRTKVTAIIDAVLSERAEDLVEDKVLRQQHGDRLIRAGHRAGESIALPDGIVPGADFYVLDASETLIEFVEVKSVSGNLPFSVAFTRGEYIRATKCADADIPYRLILVDVGSGQIYEVSNFAKALASLRLSETLQFVIRVAA